MVSRVSIIVVTYNVREETLACLRALAPQLGDRPGEIIVVDNASADGTVEAVRRERPEALVLPQRKNLGFAAAVNLGIERSSADLLLLLNPDTLPAPGFLAHLAGALESHPEAGAVGPRAYWDEDKSFLISSLKIPPPSVSWLNHSLLARSRLAGRRLLRHWREDWRYWTLGPEPFPVPAVGGAYMMVRRSALAQAGGGFDPGFFLGYEDVDLCLRLRRSGWQLLAVPRAEIVHFYGASMRKAPQTLAECVSWSGGARRFTVKHFGPVRARAVGTLLAIERRARERLGDRPSPPAGGDAVDASPTGTIEWDETGAGDEFLVEIATSASFFDKLGVFVRGTGLRFPRARLRALCRRSGWYRVLPLPLGSAHPCRQGRLEI